MSNTEQRDVADTARTEGFWIGIIIGAAIGYWIWG